MTSVNTDPPNEGVLPIELEKTVMASREEFFSLTDEHVEFLRNLEEQYQRAEEHIANGAIDMDFYQSLKNCPSENDTPVLNNFALLSEIKDESSISISDSILKDLQQLNLQQSFFTFEKQVFEFKSGCTEAARKMINEANAPEVPNANSEKIKEDFAMAVKKSQVQLDVFCCRWNQLSRCTSDNVKLTAKQTAELDWPLNADNNVQLATLLDRINFFEQTFGNLNRIALRHDALRLEFKDVLKGVYQKPPTITNHDRWVRVNETHKGIKMKCEDLEKKWTDLDEKRETPSIYFTTALNFMLVTQRKINYLYGIVGTTITLFGDAALKHQEQENERVQLARMEASIEKMKVAMEKLQEECHAALDQIIESDTVFEPSGVNRVFI
ncbi:hypothetical protein CAEBREN_21555 [Caenorhabditis brenneri]|uniref:Uncharacterized protein n=1 Tax=Caenorhabditis brenneri TaxID=135651 RepID=G0MQQ8_CAEBE|nr:hypothetical protein CAEBREN_21555 [Caenorhabditis brenneri]